MNTLMSQLMLKTSALMRLSSDLIFVGVYSTITYQPLALADREYVQVNPDNNENDWKTFVIVISSNQVRAIVAHIVSSRPALTRIDVAGLNFLCFRSKSTASLTGTSNFNVDYQDQEISNHLFEVTRHHYSMEYLDKHRHPVQMSAMLRDDCLVVGLCKASSSSLKLVREIVEHPTHDPQVPTEYESSETETMNARNPRLSTINQSYEKADMDLDESSNDVECGNVILTLERVKQNTENGSALLIDRDTDVHQKSIYGGDYRAQDDSEIKPLYATSFKYGHDNFRKVGQVERRSTRRSFDVRRQQQRNRETEFCEDWHTATIRSLEALKMIGPFTSDVTKEDDKSSLIDNIETNVVVDVNVGGGDVDKNRPPMSRSCSETGNRKRARPTDSRRPSRATMV